MAYTLETPADSFVVGTPDNDQGATWLSPAMIGVVTPVVVGLMVAPHVLQGATGVVVALLVVVLVLAVGAYALSLLMPGEPVGLAFNFESRTLAVVRQGPLARATVDLPFAEIAHIKLAIRFDRDGYQQTAVEVYSRDGDHWIVPADIDETDLVKLRQAIGLRSSRR
jgi:hypothetical protein